MGIAVPMIAHMRGSFSAIAELLRTDSMVSGPAPFLLSIPGIHFLFLVLLFSVLVSMVLCGRLS